MISRFNQFLLASTMTTPLLLSIAVVVITLYPSGYGCGWVDLISRSEIPTNILWWLPTSFILLFLLSVFETYRIFHGLLNKRRGKNTITLSSLQPLQMNNVLQFFTLLPPWLTFMFKRDLILMLILAIVFSLVFTYILSRQGYSSLIFGLLGYRTYEGKNRNGMNITLLSKRAWNSHADIRHIVPLSDSLALIV